MVLFWIETILLAYFVYVALYTFVFSVAGRLYIPPRLTRYVKTHYKFGVLIPAYKEDGVIVNVAKAALLQTYPSTHYDVVVIADSLQQKTLEALKQLRIKVIEVSFEKSTKVKALNQALSQMDGHYDYAVILDADNIMTRDFLSLVNNLHNQGFNAIQGRRAAKNKNNSLSLLDGLSEEINNHILGKGSSALGLSAALKGSGMSFRYDLLKKHLATMQSIGGFDRELELRLVNDHNNVLYAHQAVVLDERVEKTEAFENQRKRWISSQYVYLKAYFFQGIVGLLKGRIAFFNSTVLRNIQLPRLLNLGLLVAFTTLSGLASFWTSSMFNSWLIVSSLTFLGTILAIPQEYYGKPLWSALFALPGIFIKMLMLLFKLKGANKTFIHTPHTSNSPDQI